MNDFDPTSALSLAAVLEDADGKATPGEWKEWGLDERERVQIKHATGDGGMLSICLVDSWDRRELNASAIATLRNHAAQAAAQLRAACGEVERWRSGCISDADRDSLVGRLEAARAAASTEVERLKATLQRISDIRDSIVGMQAFNFSEHAYPLVAALDGAGFKGAGYEIARRNLGTLIEQTKAAESDRDSALADVARLREENERLASERDESVRVAAERYQECEELRAHYGEPALPIATPIQQLKAERDALKTENERMRKQNDILGGLAIHDSNERNRIREVRDSIIDDLQAQLAASQTECERLKAQTWQQANELVRWRHGVQIEGDYVCDHALELDRMRAVHAFDEWHEDAGPALWWMLPVCEPPYCGTPLDDDWPFDDDERPSWTTLMVPTERAIDTALAGARGSSDE